jgi:hypothetical protein
VDLLNQRHLCLFVLKQVGGEGLGLGVQRLDLRFQVSLLVLLTLVVQVLEVGQDHQDRVFKVFTESGEAKVHPSEHI